MSGVDWDAICAEWTGRDWDGTIEHLQQALGVQHDYTEALTAYAEWLARLKTRAETRGIGWSRPAMLSLSRAEDPTCPPPWATDERWWT